MKRTVCENVDPYGTAGGFTLIEVMVTIVILAVSLVSVLQLFSIGLKASLTSCDYTTAVVYAKQKMEELVADPVAGSGEYEDKFSWETEVAPYEEIGDRGNEEVEAFKYNVMKVKVKITWSESSEKKRSVEMLSLKTVETEDE